MRELYLCQQLHTVSLDSMQTSALCQLLHRDRFARIQPPLINPALYTVQIDWTHFHLERIVLSTSTLRVRDPLRCLTSLKACRHLSVSMLTLLTTSSSFSLARSRTATALDPLVVGTFIV